MRRFEIQTSAGALEILYTSRGVARISFPPRPSRPRNRVPLGNHPCEEFMRRFSDEIIRYFLGHRVTFTPPLDLASISRFDRRVLSVIRSIPYGEVRSYGWVARRVGIPGGGRAIGGACRRNPCPIVVPCHRVIEAGGGLGGYSRGFAWKCYLLDLEKNIYNAFTFR